MPTYRPNYTGTHTWTAQDLLNYVLGQHGTASPASGTLGEFLRIGGMVATAPGTNADGVDLITWVDRRGFVNPHVDGLTLFATTTASNQTTSTGTTMTGLGALNGLAVLLDVTGTAGDAGTTTLDVFIDSQMGGTKWINIGRFSLATSQTANIGYITRLAGTSAELVSATGNAGNGTFRNIGFGDSIRARYSVIGNTANYSFTLYISGVA